jgi:hypothetical protein
MPDIGFDEAILLGDADTTASAGSVGLFDTCGID